MNTIYGEVIGLVCVRYWIDAWECGWLRGYPGVASCHMEGFLCSDYANAPIGAWDAAYVEDRKINNNKERGYYGVLIHSRRHVLLTKNPAAVVEARGRIDIHEDGCIRAEQMRILHLFLPETIDSTYLRKIRERYKVPISLVKCPLRAIDEWLRHNETIIKHNEELINWELKDETANNK